MMFKALILQAQHNLSDALIDETCARVVVDLGIDC
jgi:hypothetical protein